MRKARKVIPITQGKRSIPLSADASVHEEFRILIFAELKLGPEAALTRARGPIMYRASLISYPGKARIQASAAAGENDSLYQ